MPVGPRATALARTAVDLAAELARRTVLDYLGLIDTRCESPAEAFVWGLILEAELLLPVRQFRVAVGGRRHYVDFAWPGFALALEIDGLVKYVGDSGADAIVRERHRQGGLQSAGRHVVRWLVPDVYARPQVLVADIARRLSP